MTSKVEIVNIALSRLGADSINALTEATEGARQASLLWNSVRDIVLRDFPWNCAAKTAPLAQVADYTHPEWEYAYQHPADCVYARRVFNGGSKSKKDPEEFRVVIAPSGVSKIILARISEAYLEYTARITDPSLYDGLLVDALAWRLGAEMAMPVTGNAAYMEKFLEAYRQSLMIAYGIEANEGREPLVHSTTYVSSRM